MKTTKIVKDYLKMSDAKLEIFAEHVISCMTNNANFPAPLPTLDVIKISSQEYQASLIAAQSRDSLKGEVKRDAKTSLQNNLDMLANYVTFVAAGSRPILAGSGYTISKEVSNGTTLGEIGNFSAAIGKNSGEADVSVDTVDNAKFYLFYYAIAGTDKIVWEQKEATVPYCTITGLDPLKPYLFKIKAVGSKGKSVETKIVTQVVL